MKKPYFTQMGRRAFIRNVAGATFALPFMPSLLGEEALAAGGTAKNFFFMRCGNGVMQHFGPGWSNTEFERFWPTAPEEAQTNLTKALLDQQLPDGRTCALQELREHADKMLLLQGLAYHDWRSSTAGCGHAEGGIRCFTASKPQQSGRKNRARASGISFDWYLYNQFNQAEEWKPLVLSSGVSSSYLGPVLSYRSPGTVEGPQYNPWSVYRALFGMGGGNPRTDRQAELIAQRKNSINDFVRDELNDLVDRRKVSKEDWEKLERHKASIRDVELQMNEGVCGLTNWEDVQAEFDGRNDSSLQRSDLIESLTKLHMDIAAISFSCGIRRNISIQIGNGNDQTVYKTASNPNGQRFHWISHGIEGDGGDDGSVKRIPQAEIFHHEIDRLFASWFNYFAGRLDDLGVLDETIAVWTNDISTGNHHMFNIPYVIVGGGNSLKNGRMLNFNPNQKHRGRNSDTWQTHNLMFNTIASALGVGGTPNFGVGTNAGILSPMLK